MMNDNVTYFVPADMTIVESIKEPMVLVGDDGSHIKDLLSRVGERAVGVCYTGGIGKYVRDDQELDRTIVIEEPGSVLLEDVVNMKSKSASFRCRQITLVEAGVTLENIKYITSCGITADVLNSIETEDPAMVQKYADYYCHNDNLQATVEPFHTLLAYFQRRNNVNLWDVYHCNPHKYLYVDDGGFIHERHGSEEALGHINDNENDKLKKRRKKYDAYLSSLKETKCVACHHFSICRGYCLYEKDVCDKWLPLLDYLREKGELLILLHKQLQDAVNP